jgi:hypothetical protein
MRSVAEDELLRSPAEEWRVMHLAFVACPWQRLLHVMEGSRVGCVTHAARSHTWL